MGSDAQGTAERHGLTPAGAASVLAVVAVLILVSLPRLQAFALEENEADAASLSQLLGERIEQMGPMPTPDLRALVDDLGLRRTDDAEWLDDGRLLRRHGYLFELLPSAEGPGLRAWPWCFAETGRTAFLVRPGAPLLRHSNPAGAWSGRAAPPPVAVLGWTETAPTELAVW